jgi:DNA repair protein RadC
VRATRSVGDDAIPTADGDPVVSLSDWPRSERPREHGELLAVLLGAGIRGQNAAELARRLLDEWGGLAKLLGGTAAELVRAKGLGPARAARLVAALELGRRYLEAPQDPRSALQAPVDAARFFKARLLDLPHEVFCCLFLDTRHRLIRYEELFRGTIDGATVYPREVVKRALQHNASAVILGHNPESAAKCLTLNYLSERPTDRYPQEYPQKEWFRRNLRVRRSPPGSPGGCETNVDSRRRFTNGTDRDPPRPEGCDGGRRARAARGRTCDRSDRRQVAGRREPPRKRLASRRR